MFFAALLSFVPTCWQTSRRGWMEAGCVCVAVSLMRVYVACVCTLCVYVAYVCMWLVCVCSVCVLCVCSLCVCSVCVYFVCVCSLCVCMCVFLLHDTRTRCITSLHSWIFLYKCVFFLQPIAPSHVLMSVCMSVCLSVTHTHAHTYISYIHTHTYTHKIHTHTCYTHRDSENYLSPLSPCILFCFSLTAFIISSWILHVLSSIAEIFFFSGLSAWTFIYRQNLFKISFISIYIFNQARGVLSV